MNGIYLYFVNKHLSSLALLGLQGIWNSSVPCSEVLYTIPGSDFQCKSIVLTVVMWEAASGFERILCRILVKRNSGNHGLVHLPPSYTCNLLYARRRRDILWDHLWRAGGRRPVLCPEHISKTTLARVMKFHGWIDLIQGECSAQES